MYPWHLWTLDGVHKQLDGIRLEGDKVSNVTALNMNGIVEGISKVVKNVSERLDIF